MNAWIPVKKGNKVPANGRVVMVTLLERVTGRRYVCYASLHQKGWVLLGGCPNRGLVGSDIIAWRNAYKPLPYEGEVE